MNYLSSLGTFVNSWIPYPLTFISLKPPAEPIVEEMASGYSTVSLPDGAKLAYEVLGSIHLNDTLPLVLICGMSSVRGEFEDLSRALMKTRTVLIYDHRGIGHSTLSTSGDEEISIELFARDLAFLINHLKWKKVALCGFSMGGVVAQQLLVLPHHPHRPLTLSFQITHLLLAGTRSVVQAVGLQLKAPIPNKPYTPEERKEIARRVLFSLFDPTWISQNNEHFGKICRQSLNNLSLKSSQIIMKQGIALQKFDFSQQLGKLPHDFPVLVIHGQLDQVIPFWCGEEILKRIPSARLVQQGNTPGTVPSLDFGHYWFEYFDKQVWHDVVDIFIGDEGKLCSLN